MACQNVIVDRPDAPAERVDRARREIVERGGDVVAGAAGGRGRPGCVTCGVVALGGTSGAGGGLVPGLEDRLARCRTPPAPRIGDDHAAPTRRGATLIPSPRRRSGRGRAGAGRAIEHDDDRQRGDDRAGDDEVRAGRGRRLDSDLQADLDGGQSGSLVIALRPQVLVPRAEERENSASAPSVGPRQRHRHLAEEAEVAEPVDRRRLPQVLRDRAGTPGAAGTCRTRWPGTGPTRP